jgi:flagellar protein FlgJ
MVKPVMGGSRLPPPSLEPRKMNQGEDAFSAPTSPARQLPMIDKSQVNPELLKAAEGMEAMFLDYMMKVMRQTVPKNDMDLDSPATEIYQGMMDSENAQRAAHAGGVGLADQIIAYLGGQGYNKPQGHGVPKKEKP